MENEPPNIVYAGFGVRFLASVVDSILVLPVLGVFIALIYRSEGNWLQMLMLSRENIWLNYGLPATLTLAFWLIKQATPGKIIVHTKIVDAKTLNKPSSAQLTIRYISYYLSLFPFGLGFFWIIWDKKSAAGTIF